MNKILLVGRIGRTPKITTTENSVVAKFSLATDEFYAGEKQTEWHQIEVWGKTAEYVGAYLDKGAIVEVEGRNQTRGWEDKDGNKRYTTEVIAHSVKGLVKGATPENAEGQGSSQGNDDFEDDEIPF